MTVSKELINTYSIEFDEGDELYVMRAVCLGLPQTLQDNEKTALKSLLIKALISDLMIGLPSEDCLENAKFTFTTIFGNPEARLDYQDPETLVPYINVHSLTSNMYDYFELDEFAESFAKYLGRKVEVTKIGYVVPPN